MTDLIEQFREEYQTYHRITDKRARQQRDLLRRLEVRLNGRSLVECDAGDFQAFLGELAASRKPTTVRKLGNMIRPFFSWAYGRGLMDDGRYRQLRAVKDPRGACRQSKPNPYTRKELAAFRAAVEDNIPLLPTRGTGSRLIQGWLVGRIPWQHGLAVHAMRLQVDAIVALALHCGLRRAEIHALTPDELHYDNEYVVVRGKADPNTGEPKERAVPFTEDARQAVRAWLDFREMMRPTHGQTWLMCRNRGAYEATDPLTLKPGLEELLRRWVGPGWTLHRFRHTFATERLRAGTPLEIVSITLGHSNLEQTRAYAEIVRQDVTRELAKSEGRFLEAVA